MNSSIAGDGRIGAAGGNAATVERVYSKVSWRIMPLLVVCCFIAYLSRIHIGYAQLQMKATRRFSDAVYGLGAGIFFVGDLAAGMYLLMGPVSALRVAAAAVGARGMQRMKWLPDPTTRRVHAPSTMKPSRRRQCACNPA